MEIPRRYLVGLHCFSLTSRHANSDLCNLMIIIFFLRPTEYYILITVYAQHIKTNRAQTVQTGVSARLFAYIDAVRSTSPLNLNNTIVSRAETPTYYAVSLQLNYFGERQTAHDFSSDRYLWSIKKERPWLKVHFLIIYCVSPMTQRSSSSIQKLERPALAGSTRPEAQWDYAFYRVLHLA